LRQPAKEATAPADQRRIEQANGRPAPELRDATAPVSASHDALGGSPLDPRLTLQASDRPLQHAGPCSRARSPKDAAAMP
jgi:hypothetical protein